MLVMLKISGLRWKMLLMEDLRLEDVRAEVIY